MRFNRLLGGGRALASAAAAILDDDTAEAEKPAAPVGADPSSDPDPAPAADPATAADPTPEPDPAPDADPAPAADPTPTAASEADIRAEERERVTKVFASDVAVGKERAAAKLLANPKLSADDIVALLPDIGAQASDGMLSTLASTQNPDLGAGAEPKGDAKAGAAVWDKIRGR